MTNKKAIELLESIIPNPDVKIAIQTELYMQAIDLAIKALESSSWIPVSKSLPEKKGYFLTSTAFDEVYCDFWNGEEFERTEMILAWMPLPQPYTKEEQS